MFGTLLARVPDPFALMDAFHVIYALAIVVALIRGVFGMIGGLALSSGAPWGRPVMLIAAFLALSALPLGTTLGIYTLIVLLPIE
jgi:hypothetical protein